MTDRKLSHLAAAITLGACMTVAAGVGLAWASDEPSPSPATSQPSAAASASPVPAGSPVAATLDQPFELTMGESALVDDVLVVTFVAVLEDSRCPSNVECVWEGNAEISVEVAQAGEEPATFGLNSHPDFETEARYLDHTVALVDLAPYPVIDAPSPGPFVATLTVSTDGG